MDFAVLREQEVNIKENEKREKYVELDRELKKFWSMKLTVIPIIYGVFGTVPKGLVKGLEKLEIGGRTETIQTTAQLRSARIVRRVLETQGNLLSLELQWKTISYRRCQKLARRKGIIIMIIIIMIIIMWIGLNTTKSPGNVSEKPSATAGMKNPLKRVK